MTAKNMTELEKDIQRKQRALARAKREARLAPLKEKTNAEALAEFRRTGQVPQFLRREIEQAFGVKTMTGSVKHLWGDKALPASTFVKGAYRYAVGARIIGGDDGRNRQRAAALPEGSALKKFLAAGGPPARLRFDITKRNRDSRIWHDGRASYCVDPADVVSMLRRFMRHVAEDEKKSSRASTHRATQGGKLASSSAACTCSRWVPTPLSIWAPSGITPTEKKSGSRWRRGKSAGADG